MQAKGLAARAGRWSTENRKKAIWGWLAFVVIAVVIGGGVGSKELEDADTYQGESGRAEQALVDAGLDPPAGETVMIKSDTLEAGDRQFDAAIADVESRIEQGRGGGERPGRHDLEGSVTRRSSRSTSRATPRRAETTTTPSRRR